MELETRRLKQELTEAEEKKNTALTFILILNILDPAARVEVRSCLRCSARPQRLSCPSCQSRFLAILCRFARPVSRRWSHPPALSELESVTAPSPAPLWPADLLAAPQHVSTTALVVPGAWSTLPRLQAEWLVLFKCLLSAGPFQTLH